MKKICKTCKYWSLIREDDYKINNDYTWFGPHGNCKIIDDLTCRKKDKAWTSMYCECNRYYEDQEASLITKPDFGCILWKNKNEKNA
ncbi:MAG: hypothetical protein ACFE9S_07635 [Candidatus Hermodarchaeota archaeon]